MWRWFKRLFKVRTAEEVLREIEEGLRDGSVVLENKMENYMSVVGWMKAIEEQERLFGNSNGSMLPSICMDLRLGVNCPGDKWSPERIKETVEMLQSRLETWQPSLNMRCAGVDAAVFLLVYTTVKEVLAEIWWQT